MIQKRHILAAFGMIMVNTALAQNLNSAYFTEDFKYRHSMNPALENEQNYISIPALGGINARTQGDFGYDVVVLSNPLAGQTGQKSMTTFMNPYIDISTALDGFSTGNNRIVVNASIAVLSAGFRGFGGYNTIELNAKASAGAVLPYELFEFAKNTGNRTYNIGDIRASALSYAELAFGHSHQLSERFRIGAKLKILFGIGRADIGLENMKADLADANQWVISGTAKTDVSIKGFQYIEESKDYKEDLRGTYRRVKDIDVSGFGIGGLGLAVDIGGVYRLNKQWTVSAALLDLGFIRWTNDQQAQNTNSRFTFGGFHDASVSSDRPGANGTFEQQGDKYLDQITDFINVQDQGDQGSRMTGVGATLNAGVEYTLPSYDKLKLGLLSSTRLNGYYTWTEAKLSANWTPLQWLNGGLNIGMCSFGASMGWVLNIHPRGYNFFIGMDHMLGKLSKEFIPLSSNASLSLGMNITW